mgnify:CR=1 FL=1
MANKLRIKIDHEGVLKWMFCDLHSIKNIKDLKKDECLEGVPFK